MVTFSSSAQQHSGRSIGGENVWTDPRLAIGQVGLEEKGLGL